MCGTGVLLCVFIYVGGDCGRSLSCRLHCSWHTHSKGSAATHSKLQSPRMLSRTRIPSRAFLSSRWTERPSKTSCRDPIGAGSARAVDPHGCHLGLRRAMIDTLSHNPRVVLPELVAEQRHQRTRDSTISNRDLPTSVGKSNFSPTVLTKENLQQYQRAPRHQVGLVAALRRVGTDKK